MMMEIYCLAFEQANVLEEDELRRGVEAEM